MYINKKHLTLYTHNCDLEICPPKLYVDWFYMSPNLKRSWKSNKELNVMFGFFGRQLNMVFKWGHIEREKTQEETNRLSKINELARMLNK